MPGDEADRGQHEQQIDIDVEEAGPHPNEKDRNRKSGQPTLKCHRHRAERMQAIHVRRRPRLHSRRPVRGGCPADAARDRGSVRDPNVCVPGTGRVDHDAREAEHPLDGAELGVDVLDADEGDGCFDERDDAALEVEGVIL